MSTNTPPKSGFNPELQGLRAVAILLVVVYHADHSLLSGGYVGVDVFFAISGFLITGLLAHEVAKKGTVDLGRFWARRARRLLPAAIFVLMGTLVLARFRLSPLELKMFGSASTMTALYAGNIWFAVISTDYLQAGEAATNPILHYWSLCVEEQFYLLWPLLILLFVWLARRTSSRRLEPVMFVGLLVVTVVSLAGSWILTGISQPWGFFSMPARGWEFALGGLTGMMVSRSRPASRWLANGLALGGFALIGFASVTFDERTFFPGYAALVPVVGTCMVLAVSRLDPGVAVSRFLRWKPMQVMGDLSYSWYLWHWPVMAFLRDAAGSDPALWGGVGAVVSLGMAWATYVLVENPFRFSKKLAASNTLSIATGIALALFGATASLGVRHMAGVALEDPVQQRIEAARTDLPSLYDDDCHALYDVVEHPECVYGNPSSDTTIVLFGDSHAAQWFTPLDSIVTRRGWRLVSLTKTHCPPFFFEPFDPVLVRPYPECTAWQNDVFQRIVDLRPTLVIMGVSGEYDLPQEPTDALHDEIAQWTAGVREVLGRLEDAGITTALLRDTPWLTFRAPRCLSKAAWLGEDPSETCVFEPVGPPPRLEERIALEVAEATGAFVVDMGPVICSSGPCSVERDGMILYSDADHLTDSFALSLADALAAQIDAVLGRGAPDAAGGG